MKKLLLSFVLILAFTSIAFADMPSSSDIAVLMSVSGDVAITDITFLPSVTMLSTKT